MGRRAMIEATMKHHILLGIGLLSLAACVPGAHNEKAVRAAIETANHCEQTSDCVVVTSVCPFDCYALAHKDEAAALEAMFQSYETDCTYSCIPVPEVTCIDQRCQFQD